MLSAVIITFNEEANIKACIESVQKVADEVYVLDSFSTDKTCEIAKSMGARVEQHAFDGHIQQKNRAKSNAKFDFVLSLDADEVLSTELCDVIIKEKTFGFTQDGYTMNRLNFYCGKPIKTCGWYPDKKMRLWNKNLGDWTGKNPHDRFELHQSQNIKHLEGDLLHNTYPTHQDMVNQVNKFAKISSVNLKEKSKLYLIFKLIVGAPFKFIRSYIIKLGFMDGKAGFLISYYQAKEVFKKYKLALGKEKL